MTHTPGPWKVDLYDAPFEMAQITDSTGLQIGAVDIAGRSPADIANARLIACAPDLLLVAKRAADQLDKAADSLADSGNTAMSVDCVDMAVDLRHFIARASII